MTSLFSRLICKWHFWMPNLVCLYIYIFMYICMCACLCTSVCIKGKIKETKTPQHSFVFYKEHWILGTSLVVQWLSPCYHWGARGMGLILVRELKSHILFGVAKKTPKNATHWMLTEQWFNFLNISAKSGKGSLVANSI